jgi:hypothetical protein
MDHPDKPGGDEVNDLGYRPNQHFPDGSPPGNQQSAEQSTFC